MDLREIDWEGEDWINLDQDRDQWRAFVKPVMSLRFPHKAWNFFTSLVTICFSKTRTQNLPYMKNDY